MQTATHNQRQQAPTVADKSNPLCRRDVQLFLIGLVLSLIAKGVALFPFAQSLDTYPKLVAMSENPGQSSGVYEEFVAQGRLGQWALHKALEALGIVGPGGDTFYVFVAMCCFAACGVLLCKLWKIADAGLALPACVVGIFTIHPYQAEIFTYREATITVGIAVLLAIWGLLLAERYGARWMAGCVALFVALNLYQIAVNYIAVALIVLCLLEWLRAEPEERDAKSVLFGIAPRAVAAVGSIAFYMVFYKLSLKLIPAAAESVEAPRAAVLGLAALQERARTVLHTLKYVFTTSEPLMPFATKFLIAILFLLAALVLVKRAWQSPGLSRWLEMAGAGILLVAGCVSVVGILIALSIYTPFDRTLSAITVLVAGVLAIAVVSSGSVVRNLGLAVACVLLFGFLGSNNVALQEQLRLNSRDREMANRIILRLESEPEFASAKKLAVIGDMRDYPLGFHSTKPHSDVNNSAFSRPWSKANIIREVSGYRFQKPSSEDLDRALAYCATAKPWPQPGSVAVLGDLAVVYLSKEP